MIDFAALAAPFPRDAVHWRGQKLTFKKDKALALAYLDARDVMDRLDDIAGPGNWQDTYAETPRGRVVCTIAIKVGDEWVAKSDGAGDTDVEGEKGGISDAFKRAAVKWGIGRYLYRMGQTWVPCDIGENGKFKSFTDDPWKYVRNAPDQPKAAERKAAPKANPTTTDRDADEERWRAWVEKEALGFGGKDRQFLEDWKEANAKYTNKLARAFPDLSSRLWTAFDLALDDAVASGRPAASILAAG